MAISVTGRRTECAPFQVPGKWLFAPKLDKRDVVDTTGFAVTKLALRGRAPSPKMSAGAPAPGQRAPSLAGTYHAAKVRLQNADKHTRLAPPARAAR